MPSPHVAVAAFLSQRILAKRSMTLHDESARGDCYGASAPRGPHGIQTAFGHWEVCVGLGRGVTGRYQKSQKASSTQGLPGRSPTPVLTGPSVAYLPSSNGIGSSPQSMAAGEHVGSQKGRMRIIIRGVSILCAMIRSSQKNRETPGGFAVFCGGETPLIMMLPKFEVG